MTRPWPRAEPRLRPPATPWLRSSATSVASGRLATAAAREGEVVRAGALVDDEDMARDAELRQGGVDRGDGFLGPIEREDQDVGVVVLPVGAAGAPAMMADGWVLIAHRLLESATLHGAPRLRGGDGWARGG